MCLFGLFGCLMSSFDFGFWLCFLWVCWCVWSLLLWFLLQNVWMIFWHGSDFFGDFGVFR